MNPKEIYQTFMEAGNQYAEAKFAYYQLHDQTKSLLASLTLAAKDVDGVKSMAEAKEIGLASSSYRDHLYTVADHHLIFMKAEVKYEAIKRLFEAQRTVESTNRAAMRSST
jgi:hypothetical protein